jgi:Rod binding domain-containing protein
MSPIAPGLPVSPLAGPDRASAPTVKKTSGADLKKAAGEFESVLIRQILQAAHLGGKSQGASHGDMIVDSLSKAIAAGGGLGLSRVIEAGIGGPTASVPPPPKVPPTPTVPPSER